MDVEDDPVAQYDLGVAYANGDGVPEDKVEAVRWWRLAAEQGYGPAQFALGSMYEEGRGVPRDAVLAYMWFNVVAARSTGTEYETARLFRVLIENNLPPDQRAEAQRLAREWDEAHPRD